MGDNLGSKGLSMLAHRSGRITTHSDAEPSRLILAANSVCERSATHVELMVLRGSLKVGPAKFSKRI